MQTTKSHDSLGRTRRVSQGGAGPKPLPSKDAPRAGQLNTTPPPHLKQHGLWFWDKALASLLPMGFIDAADEISLILAAEAWEDYQTYRETIIRDGDTMMDPQGKVYLHPLMNSKSKGWQFVFTSLSSLGLTASARAKFGGEVKEDDPWPTFKNTRGN